LEGGIWIRSESKEANGTRWTYNSIFGRFFNIFQYFAMTILFCIRHLNFRLVRSFTRGNVFFIFRPSRVLVSLSLPTTISPPLTYSKAVSPSSCHSLSPSLSLSHLPADLLRHPMDQPADLGHFWAHISEFPSQGYSNLVST
jgi:hypothetical protein